MDMENVDSTCIAEAGYDPVTDDLAITFREDGRTVTYHSVSGHQFSRMLASPSPGWYFNRYIRGHYSFD